MASLREALRNPLPRNDQQRDRLKERLHALPDEALLDALRAGGLPPEPLGMLLDELGDDRRVRERRPEMRHDLCREVLDNGLYFEPNGPGAEYVSQMAMARRAAALFHWAVLPLAKDARYRTPLQELLHHMCRNPSPAAGNWLWDSIVAPANGIAPDLPPEVWQSLLRSMYEQRLASTPAAPAPTAQPPAPASPTTAPDPPAFGSRFNEWTSSLGCVVGSGVGVILVLLTIVLIFA
ncbi:hypothetical protein [Streptomyces endophytica]|uniref:Uncharacterized protein n=1 Tax=Streptomyces endophytica TaxID=2991496 RepID=A0ABY6P9U9_9ACTN|nr:hypothetical protein [Streptomyces endophytica]UZJ30598.1 hypothetical protein OJ254_09820 [Streptomyces endophytica]